MKRFLLTIAFLACSVVTYNIGFYQGSNIGLALWLKPFPPMVPTIITITGTDIQFSGGIFSCMGSVLVPDKLPYSIHGDSVFGTTLLYNKLFKIMRHRQILADDQFIIGHAVGKHLVEFFDELLALLDSRAKGD